MKYKVLPTIKYKQWKKLCDAVPDSGPTPIEGDRILWEMLTDRQIDIYIDTKEEDPIIIKAIK